VALAVVVGASACGAPAPEPMAMQGTSEDETAIRGLGDRYVAAFNANDVAAMTSMVSDNYEVVEADGTHVSGRAAYQQMLEKDVAGRQGAGITLALTATTDFVRWLSATHAVVGGKWSGTGLPPGAPASGSWMGVVAKSPTAEWQYLSALVSTFMPPSPPAGEAAGS
jgi:hypothetical protein